jgi:hypothetical protein
LSEEQDLQMRLHELERLRAEYAAQGKPNIVSFLDGLITDTRSALAGFDGIVNREWDDCRP